MAATRWVIWSLSKQQIQGYQPRPILRSVGGLLQLLALRELWKRSDHPSLRQAFRRMGPIKAAAVLSFQAALVVSVLVPWLLFGSIFWAIIAFVALALAVTLPTVVIEASRLRREATR